MAGAMLSMSDSLHASIIIHQQLQRQLQQDNVKARSRGEGEDQNSSRKDGAPPGVERGGDLSDTEEDKTRAVGLCDSLMLVSALFGIEMCMSFEQIFEILFLRFLGVPVSLVSMNGLIAGATGVIYLPIVGVWADKGRNPKARKLIALYAGLFVFLTGLVLLIVASFIKMEQLKNIEESEFNIQNNTNGNIIWVHEGIDNTDVDKLLIDNTLNPFNQSPSFSLVTGSLPITPNSIDLPNTDEHDTLTQYAKIPAIVIISIIGFAGLDIGFDVTVSLSRALILENVPEFQHMRVLVLATIVQSSAGASCSLIGCFDLPKHLGAAFDTDGAAASLVFFCCILFVATLAGFVFMSIASYRLGKKNRSVGASWTPRQQSLVHDASRTGSCGSLLIQRDDSTSNLQATLANPQPDLETSSYTRLDQSPATKPRMLKKTKSVVAQLELLHEDRPYVPDILHTEEGDTSTRPLLLEDSLKQVTYSALDNRAADEARHGNEENVGSSRTDVFRTNSNSCTTSLLGVYISGDGDAPKYGRQATFDPVGVSSVISAMRLSYSMSMSQRVGGLGDFHNRKLAQLKEAQNKVNTKERKERHRTLRKRLVILCVSAFFAMGASISFSVYSSNTMNLGIMHGDPNALPGTPGRDNYERGLQLGAVGNFLSYATFMAVSMGNTKLINSIGEKGQYVLFHVLMIVALCSLFITQLLEVYFVCMVFYGLYRTCMLTLPFVLAHKFTQEGLQKDESEPGEQVVTHTGRVMTLIGFLIPTHYMILSTLMGPLMDTTGSAWMPLFYSLAASSASLVTFCLLFFV